MERATLTACTTARLSDGTGTIARSSRFAGGRTNSGADGQVAAGGRVLAIDEQHHPDEGRDQDHDQVGAAGELLEHHDHQHDRREQGADGVDPHPPPPARLRVAAPVEDHAALAEREAHEHAHRVERDQQRRDASEVDEQRPRHHRQQDDPPAEGQPVAPERELAGHVAVGGEQRGQARERVVAGVRRQEQDQRRAHLEHVVQRAARPERGLGHQRDHRRAAGSLLRRARSGTRRR